MSKDHDFGLLVSRVSVRVLRFNGRDFFVPFSAAERDKDGACVDEKAGGLNRFRGCRRPELRLRVGERPAGGADAGVIEGLTNVSRRGVEIVALGRGLVEMEGVVTFNE